MHLACIPGAITESNRPRYENLIGRLRAAILHRAELPNGYEFRLDGVALSLAEAAEWMSLERQCCPFLTLSLSATGNRRDFGLTVSGPPGAKPLIESSLAGSAR